MPLNSSQRAAQFRKKQPFRSAYKDHKSNAKRRGIEFLFSFEEWRAMWIGSGKWLLRGRKRGDYCMCRNGDKGPYSTWNVTIKLIEQNALENGSNLRAGKIKRRSKPPRFDPGQCKLIRKDHTNGLTYKKLESKYKCGSSLLVNIIHRRGAYSHL